jgi:hypothetical protein
MRQPQAGSGLLRFARNDGPKKRAFLSVHALNPRDHGFGFQLRQNGIEMRQVEHFEIDHNVAEFLRA